MTTKASMKWVKDMLFDAEITGHHILMDADTQWGGKDQGARPKPLLLAAFKWAAQAWTWSPFWIR